MIYIQDQTSAKVLADSIYLNGTRLTTIQAVFPRFILAEVNTHRALSRNSASSRAIPLAKQLDRVWTHPFIPQRFPINRAGMSATEYAEPGSQQFEDAKEAWLVGRDAAMMAARRLGDLNIHKQIATRLIEPYMWHTAIISATADWWWATLLQRLHPDAQPEFQILAECIDDAISESAPTMLDWRDWHLPLIGFEGDDSLTLPEKIKVSVGRVARVSYLNHDGKRDIDADLGLYKRLSENKPPHLSPFEHVAQPCHQPQHMANFPGWMQVRKYIELGAPLPGDR